jgi:hypothetical protein
MPDQPRATYLQLAICGRNAVAISGVNAPPLKMMPHPRRRGSLIKFDSIAEDELVWVLGYAMHKNFPLAARMTCMRAQVRGVSGAS